MEIGPHVFSKIWNLDTQTDRRGSFIHIDCEEARECLSLCYKSYAHLNAIGQLATFLRFINLHITFRYLLGRIHICTPFVCENWTGSSTFVFMNVQWTCKYDNIVFLNLWSHKKILLYDLETCCLREHLI